MEWTGAAEGTGRKRKNVPKNNERPETFSSPGRPGSPPPELLTEQIKRVAHFCLWHLRAIPTRKVPYPISLKSKGMLKRAGFPT